MIRTDFKKSSASFRDPSGFIFTHNGKIYRAVKAAYKDNLDFLISSGLYSKLIAENLLIPHNFVNDIDLNLNENDVYKIIEPEQIIFISYPYEWCFSQLKDAALLTLSIQKIALEYGMILKDASAFNIQFHNGKPIFIDTLSFEKYVEGEPWIAYRQFCSHFLAPLLLMKYRDLAMNRLLSLFIDGIPLNLTSSLLPANAFLKFSHLSHIYLHSLSEKYGSSNNKKQKVNISKNGMLGLIENLERSIRKIKIQIKNSVWQNYYEDNSYLKDELEQKRNIIGEYLNIIQPRTVIDLGSNTGLFSRIAGDRDIYTMSSDFDPHCVEINYLDAKKRREKNILPLLMDLTNPSPDLGWHNEERDSFIKRKRADAVMALALIHHLSISNNVPLEKLVLFFSELSEYLIIEFVPKEDVQVKSLLINRKDIYIEYCQENFEKIFRERYEFLRKDLVTESGRTLYLMKLK